MGLKITNTGLNIVDSAGGTIVDASGLVGTISANQITAGTLTLTSGSANLVVESGTLQLNEGAAFNIKGGTSSTGHLYFTKFDDNNRQVGFYLVEGAASPDEFGIDPRGTIVCDLRIGDVRNWNSGVINANYAITLTGGQIAGGTQVSLCVENNNFYVEFGGTTMMRLYSNGDLHIRGSIVQNDSTP